MAKPYEPAVGDTVLVNSKHVGVVRFIGATNFADGLWIGLEMHKAIGKHNGTVLGVTYFECSTPEAKHGTFVRSDAISPYNEASGGAAAVASLQASARGAAARRTVNGAVMSAAFAALDADAEAQQLQRHSRLAAAGTHEDFTHRATPSLEALDRWEREAAAEGGGGDGEAAGGPELSAPPIEAQVWELMAAFSDGKLPPFRVVLALLCAFRRWAAALPTVLELAVEEGTRLTVVGDTHGQLEDVLTIFTINGVPSAANRYLFNGDFVDRGPRGVEVMCVLMAWALAYPGRRRGGGAAPLRCVSSRRPPAARRPARLWCTAGCSTSAR